MPARTKKTRSGATSSASPADRRDDTGERAVRFLNNLTHTGDYSGEPFALRPWQADPVRRLFGTLRPDGTRQYRRAFWALPRKQGKTELVAGASLYLLLGQGRKNQRIYTASGDAKQAGLIFDAAKEMVRNDPELDARVIIYEGNEKKIVYPHGNSKLEVLSSVPKSKHGLGPTAVLIDEMHVVDPELVKVLTTGFGARKDPLTWMITTAGNDRFSICYDEWQYALEVRDGTREDPTYLPVIFAADPGDDWKAEATWRKAMPALGDFCSIEFIREEFRKAESRPRFENEFKQLYLNLWTEQSVRWLSADRWAECGRAFDLEEYVGSPCFGGLDLGVTGDMSALCLAFPNGLGGLDLLLRFWVPEFGRWRDERRSAELYPLWHRRGLLEYTDGESQDHQQIEDAIVALNGPHPIALLAADRAYATQILSNLFNRHGIPARGIPQGPVTLNEPMVRLESMMLARTLRHGGHPILAYNVANACVKRTSTGLMHLDKSGSADRIDGLAAVIDAIAAAIATPDDGPSPYAKGGDGLLWA
jgi:phage terminase large subunit-like protein